MQYLNNRKKYWYTLLIGVMVLGGYFSVPPYTFQSVYYFLSNDDVLDETDQNFTNSTENKWTSNRIALAPIVKTENGARLYYVGSSERFGRRFDISFIKGGTRNDHCTPLSIYSSLSVKCDILLSTDWVINYEISDIIELELSTIK